MTALRMPKPPHLTGKEACNHIASDRSTLRVDETVDRRNSSYSTRTELLVHGEVLSVYMSRGVVTTLRRRYRLSCAGKKLSLPASIIRSFFFEANIESKPSPDINGDPRRVRAPASTSFNEIPRVTNSRRLVSVSPTTSHLLRLSVRPSLAALFSSMTKSSATVLASPPSDTSSK